MFHWKLIVAYDGTPYHGWQVQPGLSTVQGTLAEAIQRVTGETILPQGSGRTDTGVHALGQVVSISIAATIPASNLQRALNNRLPGSIRIVSIEPAHHHFHARHSARRKTYEYRICPATVCPPTLAPFVWNCLRPLDVSAMQQAASFIVGSFDFTSFAAVDPDLATRNDDPADGKPHPPHSAVRHIFTSTWERRSDPQGCDLIIYSITGSGFLHHMVRNLVGTFVEVGRGRTPAADLPSILAARARSAAGPTAPPQGLFLVNVDYE
ncbi:MAG: tRNA pseudouridine(38-40) synthase TruA [Edaphobacter sp.]|uniref:tRNA pseudouridine(38-40) synthase TruA n=1 Tax=Edaphobacter sp. TaxID=1934404 RepID=UPI00238D65A3|nr:tRNA pseudouridine(38-40) synthase TruA [Edaphobacter sp.]MDE1178393.1 tRNA pseudouridine(38-40) synthase TruA [Edaphobacter sp.]